MVSSYGILKALTVLSIEKTLLEMGKAVYDKVVDMLYEKYHCYLPDCFENPEYLKAVLRELYGKSYDEIISSIQKELGEFAYNKRIEEFLQVLL